MCAAGRLKSENAYKGGIMDQGSLPPDLRQAMWSAAFTVLLAYLGRIMWHVRQVQKNTRRFLSWHLLWELLTALAIGFVADGIAEYCNIHGRAATALIIVVSYLGPAGVQGLVQHAIDRTIGGKD